MISNRYSASVCITLALTDSRCHCILRLNINDFLGLAQNSCLISRYMAEIDHLLRAKHEAESRDGDDGCQFNGAFQKG